MMASSSDGLILLRGFEGLEGRWLLGRALGGRALGESSDIPRNRSDSRRTDGLPTSTEGGLADGLAEGLGRTDWESPTFGELCPSLSRFGSMGPLASQDGR